MDGFGRGERRGPAGAGGGRGVTRGPSSSSDMKGARIIAGQDGSK